MKESLLICKNMDHYEYGPKYYNSSWIFNSILFLVYNVGTHYGIFFLSRSILLDKFRELKGRLARQNTSNVCCTYVFNLKVFNQFTSLQSDPPACGWNPKMWVILQSSIFICIRLSCNTIFCEIETRHFFNNYSNQATMCTSLKKKIQINTCLCQRTRWIDAKTWLQWCKVATKRWILNDLFIRNNIIVKTF